MFSSETIASLFIGGALGFIIPVGAAVVFKLKNREAWLPGVFIGAGTFIVFAMVLEQLLHAAMLPIVQGNAVLYCVYGALAAGIFEETGRFVAYKTLMRRHYSTKNAVLMGIGHGGCEALLLVGLNYITYAVTALSVNALGTEQFIQMSSAGNAEVAATLQTQLESIAGIGAVTVVQAIYERVIAMTFHVCMSVIVYKAVSQRGKVWLYPLAVVLHAVLDVPAALYQLGILTSIPAVHIAMTVIVAAAVFGTVILAKKLPDKAEQ